MRTKARKCLAGLFTGLVPRQGRQASGIAIELALIEMLKTLQVAFGPDPASDFVNR
jgi:hypothetical protein